MKIMEKIQLGFFPAFSSAGNKQKTGIRVKLTEKWRFFLWVLGP